MMAAGGGHDSVVTTLITHRLGLWVPVWQRSLSGLQREGPVRPRDPAPLGGSATEVFLERWSPFCPLITQVLRSMLHVRAVCS